MRISSSPARMWLAALAPLGFLWPASTQPRSPGGPDDRAFVAWVRQHLHEVSLTSSAGLSDLEPLRRLIGSATVVSLGEGLHGSAEPLEFRNRLFRFLVQEMGFTAIGLESGITESFPINEYVLGGPGEPVQLTARGITFGLGGFPQQAQLVAWMREYNLDPRHALKIQFYGMDVSGFPGEPHSPLDTALGYLDQVDPTASSALRERLKPLWPRLKIDRFSEGPDQYSQLAQPQRDAATAAVADLVALYEMKEGAYIAATSERAYRMAQQAAVAARQVDGYLRQVSFGWTPKDGPQSMLGTVAAADRAKMDNIRWIVEQQGEGGKLLVFAHLGHVATTSVSVRPPGQAAFDLPPLLGPYLQRAYRDELRTIGHLLALDATPCSQQLPPAPPDSLEGLFAAVKVPAFVLDLRSAPPEVVGRLLPRHDLFGQRPTHSLSVGEGVDIVLFTQSATRALPCP